MSALAVVFHRDGRSVDAAEMWPMLDAVPYRSLDGSGIRRFGFVGLGFGLLAVTPEEAGQPLVSPRTGCAVIADARLDNRDDLRAQLPDAPNATVPDAELILQAYEAWGVASVERLRGDFAYALWDPRQQRVVCARDSSGQRTLFYRLDEHIFVAGSEIHQLFQDPSVPVAPDDERIREFLVPLNMLRNEKDGPRTFFTGVSALPAGYALVVTRDAQRRFRFFTPRPPAELRYRTDDAYAEHYLALLSDVVGAHLRSSHPVGALLSGGLDSASVVCLAQELYRGGRAVDHGFTTFTSVFDGLECDERSLVEEIQTKYAFAARYIPAGGLAGRLQLKPRGFLEAPNMWVGEARDALVGAASDAGVRTLLTGEVADGCIGGSRLVFDSLLRQGRLRSFTRHLRAYRRVSDESLTKIVALHCLAPLLPLPLQRRVMATYVRRVVQRSGDAALPGWIPAALRDDLAQRLLTECLTEERERRFSNPTREAESRALYPPEVVRHPAPWPVVMSRPFADRRLHEFLLAIPPEQKFAPHPASDDFYAGSKRLARGALRGIVPESVRTRTTKTTFSAMVQNELEQQWPLYEAIFGPSGRPEIASHGYVDRQPFWSRLVAMRAGQRAPDFMYVVRLVELETWLRMLKLPRPGMVSAPPPWGRKTRTSFLDRQEVINDQATVSATGAH